MAGRLTPETTAVHEAGHAVAAMLCGVRVRRVRLTGDGGGVCVCEPLPTDNPRKSLRTALLITAAGDAAEDAIELLELAGAEPWRL